MVVHYEDEETFKRGFAKRLKETRAELGLSQPAMADLIGCSRAMYPKYESRDHYPLYLLPKLIIKTDKPSSYWLFGEPVPREMGKRGDRIKRPFKVIK